MASAGDTITYTYSGSKVSEDISSIGEITIDYIDGAGGGDGTTGTGRSGGRAENITVDVSSYNSLSIWVAQPDNGIGEGGWGRFDGGNGDGAFNTGGGGGSSEVAFPDQETGNNDAPAIAGSGGAQGANGDNSLEGGGGARGGTSTDFSDGNGTPPPQGGSSSSHAGEGYINSNMSEVSGGSTTTGGGSSFNTEGEIQISYESSAPSAPTNVHFNDTQTEDELTLDWDSVSGAAGYYVYRSQSSGTSKSDYTQVADVTSPPYTDAGLKDGERYYYRVSSYD